MEQHTKLIVDVVDRGKRRGVNQTHLAQRAGISPEQLSRLLSGRGSARVETLTSLAAAVGLRVALVPDDSFAADLMSGKLINFLEGGE